MLFASAHRNIYHALNQTENIAQHSVSLIKCYILPQLDHSKLINCVDTRQIRYRILSHVRRFHAERKLNMISLNCTIPVVNYLFREVGRRIHQYLIIVTVEFLFVFDSLKYLFQTGQFPCPLQFEYFKNT